jgi:hypothetical protein
LGLVELKERFILSEPVRLRVIKGEDRSARQGTRGRLYSPGLGHNGLRSILVFVDSGV